VVFAGTPPDTETMATFSADFAAKSSGNLGQTVFKTHSFRVWCWRTIPE
jgi:hypothetical protein